MKALVIGGGAAGMMAARTAAENGHPVTLLERQARVGRKLLATGNGRCNLTNRHAAPPHYHGQEPDFCRFALVAFSVQDTLDWFGRCGLVTHHRGQRPRLPLQQHGGQRAGRTAFRAGGQRR